MFYRIRQFARALFPSLSGAEKTWIKTILPDEALTLFYSQSLVEQRHGLDVALDIQKNILVCPDNGKTKVLQIDDHKTLLTAALLHDCGKSLNPLHLWQRAYIVLSAHIPLLYKMAELSPQLSETLSLAAAHPHQGEMLARHSHLSSEVCHLIATHHHPDCRLGNLLHEADSRH